MKKSVLIPLIIVILAVAIVAWFVVKGKQKEAPSTPKTETTEGTEGQTTETAQPATQTSEDPMKADKEAARTAAIKWRDAIIQGDLMTANSVSTHNWGKQINQSIIDQCQKNKEYAKKLSQGDFNDVTIKGNKATLKSTNVTHEAIYLIKQDNSWKVGN